MRLPPTNKFAGLQPHGPYEEIYNEFPQLTALNVNAIRDLHKMALIKVNMKMPKGLIETLDDRSFVVRARGKARGRAQAFSEIMATKMEEEEAARRLLFTMRELIKAGKMMKRS